jgi:hypothetical protein
MTNRVTESGLMNKAKRALAVALIGLLLGVVAVPETSLAAKPLPSRQVTHIVHPADGVGDSPVMP